MQISKLKNQNYRPVLSEAEGSKSKMGLEYFGFLVVILHFSF
jgi:hypothetical protein